MKPIAITMGCPAGIGAEIILKAFKNHQRVFKENDIIIFGDRNILEYTSRKLDLNVPIEEYSLNAKLDRDKLNVFSLTSICPDTFSFGRPSKESGLASYKYIETSILMALKGEISAIVTAPISKTALSLAGIDFPGHTEIFAALTSTKDYAMMFYSEKLKVVLATIHVALKDVPKLISKENLLTKIMLTYSSLKDDFAVSEPKIGICGLNPHAGEAGLFGSEEIETIVPAIKEANERGIMVMGPFPADTIFLRAIRGEFDVIIAMYHDQGLIPIKLLDFYNAVNLTIGLPIVRTSVDHGTSYDIVGKGIAREDSLVSAIRLAKTISLNRSLKGINRT